MAGRSTPPLFDLLRKDGSEKPRRTVTLAPRPVEVPPRAETPPPTRAPEPPEPAPAPAPAHDADPAQRHLRLSPTTAYAAGAGVLVALIIAWSAGVWFGERRAQREYYATLETDPIADPTLALPPQAPGGQPAPSTPPEALSAGLSGLTRVLLPGGPSTADPRLPGHNYLHLASGVGADQAQAAIDYLNTRGVRAVGVPALDRRGRPANNPPRYDLFSLLAIPSSEYSARRDQREEHQRVLRQIGRDWLARPEGNINFDSTQWRKFDP